MNKAISLVTSHAESVSSTSVLHTVSDLQNNYYIIHIHFLNVLCNVLSLLSFWFALVLGFSLPLHSAIFVDTEEAAPQEAFFNYLFKIQ